MRSTYSLLAALLALSACGGPKGFQPLVSDEVVFWDRQTTETAALLANVAEEFNRGATGPPLRVERSGNYADIYRKVTAGIQARRLPGMAVAYESMVVEYVPAGALVPLDPFITDSERGFSAAEMADFYPAALETNRYPQFGGAYYSFPFSKSVLVMYFNKRVQAAAGFYHPPRTWDEFLEQCRGIKEKTGITPLGFNVDPSNLHGIILSKGGAIVDGRSTLYDAPEAIAAFELIETLFREELAFQVPPGTYQDEELFARGEAAFTLRTSAARTHVALLMDGDMEGWGIAQIPQRDRLNPATVLYGPNVVIFDTTVEQQETAWAFIRHFSSVPTQVRWALDTGYLPVRQSALEHPSIRAFWDEWPYNRAAYDALPHARPEPNLAGWQEVRRAVERGLTQIVTRTSRARDVARALKQEADRIIAVQPWD